MVDEQMTVCWWRCVVFYTHTHINDLCKHSQLLRRKNKTAQRSFSSAQRHTVEEFEEKLFLFNTRSVECICFWVSIIWGGGSRHV